MSASGFAVGGVATAMILALIPSSSGAALPPDAVAAAPMRSQGSNPVYPRLTAFPNPTIMAKVNAAIAKQEAEDRGDRSDCIKQVLDAKQKPDAGTYHTDISVAYLSPRYLSVDVITSSDCAGAHPTDGAEAPLTFDLTTGEPVDWYAMFKPGFLPPAAGEDSAHPSSLAKIYRARYRKADPADDECRGVIADPSWSFSPTLWLSATGGLIVKPDFPFAVAACADDLALSPADLAAYVKGESVLADLRATVKRPPATRAKLKAKTPL